SSDLSSIQGEKESFDYLYELLDDYYENKAEKDRVHQQTNDLIQILNNERKKNVKKLKKLKRENEDADDADIYRVKGEILSAFMHKVEQGMDLIELENFYEIGRASCRERE